MSHLLDFLILDVFSYTKPESS